MLIGDSDAQEKDTMWPQVAMPRFLKPGRFSETGLVHLSPVRLRLSRGEPMEKTWWGQEEAKRGRQRGTSPRSDGLWTWGRKRGLRVSGLQPLVPIGNEGHQLLL